MSLVVVMNCGAGKALRGFEISMFYFFLNFILYTYPKIYCHCGHKMLQNNVNNTFPESYNAKDYENIKLVNLPLYKAAQLPLILCMISKNSDFGVGGNVKFFLQKRILCSWTQNSPIWTRILPSNYLHLNQVDIWNGFWDIIKSMTKSCPSWKSGKTTKKGNFLISASNYQRYTKFTSRYMFWWMTNTMKLVKISLRITKDVKIQDGRQLW